jgi:hypothetical protein
MIVVVASHKGGTGKTSLATLITCHWLGQIGTCGEIMTVLGLYPARMAACVALRSIKYSSTNRCCLRVTTPPPFAQKKAAPPVWGSAA